MYEPKVGVIDIKFISIENFTDLNLDKYLIISDYYDYFYLFKQCLGDSQTPLVIHLGHWFSTKVKESMLLGP